jgi:hypothetical protein
MLSHVNSINNRSYYSAIRDSCFELNPTSFNQGDCELSVASSSNQWSENMPFRKTLLDREDYIFEDIEMESSAVSWLDAPSSLASELQVDESLNIQLNSLTIESRESSDYNELSQSNPQDKSLTEESLDGLSSTPTETPTNP